MKWPQVGRAIAALHVQGRGKSALHRARRRITSGAGNAERREPAGTGPQKQTASLTLAAEGSDGEKVV